MADVQTAIAVFDKSAERTTPNAQTEAWKVLRAEIERLTDENHQLRRERAWFADRINGTPCAEIRWNQERELLEADAKRIDFLDRMFFGIKVRNGRRYDAGPGNARYIIDAAKAYHERSPVPEGGGEG